MTLLGARICKSVRCGSQQTENVPRGGSGLAFDELAQLPGGRQGDHDGRHKNQHRLTSQTVKFQPLT